MASRRRSCIISRKIIDRKSHGVLRLCFGSRWSKFDGRLGLFTFLLFFLALFSNLFLSTNKNNNNCGVSGDLDRSKGPLHEESRSWLAAFAEQICVCLGRAFSSVLSIYCEWGMALEREWLRVDVGFLLLSS
jgi:hypothetical protein